jgi:hypothetical protein
VVFVAILASGSLDRAVEGHADSTGKVDGAAFSIKPKPNEIYGFAMMDAGDFKQVDRTGLRRTTRQTSSTTRSVRRRRQYVFQCPANTLWSQLKFRRCRHIESWFERTLGRALTQDTFRLWHAYGELASSERAKPGVRLWTSTSQLRGVLGTEWMVFFRNVIPMDARSG